MHQEENGRIPGHVAPDGVTVLSINFEDVKAGAFSVNAMRGSPGQNVFTHFYRYPGAYGIPFIQADPAGRIYMVLTWSARMALVCLDGTNGNPVGMVELPLFYGQGGTQMRTFNVAPQGGLIYAEATESDMTYEWFNCHP